MLELTSVCHLSSKFLGHCVFNKASSSLHTKISYKLTNPKKKKSKIKIAEPKKGVTFRDNQARRRWRPVDGIYLWSLGHERNWSD